MIDPNYLLMMFYTCIGGWMLDYIYKMASGTFTGKSSEEVDAVFTSMLASPGEQIIWMMIAIAIGFAVCFIGLQNGVEKVSKFCMICLLLLMIVLAVRSVPLPGAAEGI